MVKRTSVLGRYAHLQAAVYALHLLGYKRMERGKRDEQAQVAARDSRTWRGYIEGQPEYVHARLTSGGAVVVEGGAAWVR